ncbi:unnamed protein product [Allacma fusca]|uniref:Uncharacterized protein n=1 Tax=Allacma fusca TaxID=39272 RepID=A0A8J2NGB1_9HEXA|nr:unnamed protein product [Allacma fusca]
MPVKREVREIICAKCKRNILTEGSIKLPRVNIPPLPAIRDENGQPLEPIDLMPTVSWPEHSIVRILRNGTANTTCFHLMHKNCFITYTVTSLEKKKLKPRNNILDITLKCPIPYCYNTYVQLDHVECIPLSAFQWVSFTYEPGNDNRAKSLQSPKKRRRANPQKFIDKDEKPWLEACPRPGDLLRKAYVTSEITKLKEQHGVLEFPVGTKLTLSNGEKVVIGKVGGELTAFTEVAWNFPHIGGDSLRSDASTGELNKAAATHGSSTSSLASLTLHSHSAAKEKTIFVKNVSHTSGIGKVNENKQQDSAIGQVHDVSRIEFKDTAVAANPAPSMLNDIVLESGKTLRFVDDKGNPVLVNDMNWLKTALEREQQQQQEASLDMYSVTLGNVGENQIIEGSQCPHHVGSSQEEVAIKSESVQVNTNEGCDGDVAVDASAHFDWSDFSFLGF